MLIYVFVFLYVNVFFPSFPIRFRSVQEESPWAAFLLAAYCGGRGGTPHACLTPHSTGPGSSTTGDSTVDNGTVSEPSSSAGVDEYVGRFLCANLLLAASALTSTAQGGPTRAKRMRTASAQEEGREEEEREGEREGQESGEGEGREEHWALGLLLAALLHPTWPPHYPGMGHLPSLTWYTVRAARDPQGTPQARPGDPQPLRQSQDSLAEGLSTVHLGATFSASSAASSGAGQGEWYPALGTTLGTPQLWGGGRGGDQRGPGAAGGFGEDARGVLLQELRAYQGLAGFRTLWGFLGVPGLQRAGRARGPGKGLIGGSSFRSFVCHPLHEMEMASCDEHEGAMAWGVAVVHSVMTARA